MSLWKWGIWRNNFFFFFFNGHTNSAKVGTVLSWFTAVHIWAYLCFEQFSVAILLLWPEMYRNEHKRFLCLIRMLSYKQKWVKSKSYVGIVQGFLRWISLVCANIRKRERGVKRSSRSRKEIGAWYGQCFAFSAYHLFNSFLSFQKSPSKSSFLECALNILSEFFQVLLSQPGCCPGNRRVGRPEENLLAWCSRR